MRRLSTTCSPEDDEIFIAFCFGLLTVNFSPLWSDVCAALKVIAGRSGAKVWEMAFSNLSLEENEQLDEAEKVETPKLNYEDFVKKLENEAQQDAASRLQNLHDKVVPLSSSD
jgi:hypothetical protein